MIHDFLLLEMYYGQTDSAQYIEEIVKRHGAEKLEKAKACGHIITKKMPFGPDKGRIMCWLSEQGRAKAGKFISPAG